MSPILLKEFGESGLTTDWREVKVTYLLLSAIIIELIVHMFVTVFTRVRTCVEIQQL